MSTDNTTNNARKFGSVAQITTLIGAQLRSLLLARKTKAILIIQLIPVLAAFVYVIFESVDGLSMFSKIVEHLTIPFLIPLAALFYGGPAIVDEMEERTLTYLTLRPIGKGVLFLGKTISAILMTFATVLIPLVLLSIVCLVQSEDFGATIEIFTKIMGASAIGIITYTSIFAALGAIFASTILSSILYFISFELILATLPILELLAVKYHVKNMAGLQTTDRLGVLDKLFMDQPLEVKWWISLGLCVALAGIASFIGTLVFRNRQYYV